MSVRRPAVAGTFYPGSRDTLIEMLKGFFRTPVECPGAAWLGAISPHAGYIYSGAVAAEVYSCLEIPSTVVILSPNHTGLGSGASVAPHDAWDTPLGRAQLDLELAQALVDASRYLEFDENAHLQEHAVEVQVPFLQYKRPDVRIVPITLRAMAYEIAQEIGHTLAEVISAVRPDALIIASSDMNHYEPQAVASRKDRIALDRVLALDPRGLFRVVYEHEITMCGFIPAVIMLNAAIKLGADKAHLVDYRTSGDVTGDYSSVVGYAGVLVGNTT